MLEDERGFCLYESTFKVLSTEIYCNSTILILYEKNTEEQIS